MFSSNVTVIVVHARSPTKSNLRSRSDKENMDFVDWIAHLIHFIDFPSFFDMQKLRIPIFLQIIMT